MQESVRAIVISRIPFKDNSTIIKLYTREKGIITCMAGKMNSSKGKIRSSFFQPLTILNLVLYNKGKGMPSVREANPVVPLFSIITDPLKSSVVIFLTEVLSHSLIESHPDSDTFDFIERSVLELEMAENCPSDFHLSFMWKLTSFIGIGPRNDFDASSNSFFDIPNGCFAVEPSQLSISISAEASARISFFLNEETPVIVNAGLTRNTRNELIYYTVEYFAFHLGWQKGIKSLGVLREVFEA